MNWISLKCLKISMLQSPFNFELRLILYIIFFVLFNLYHKGGYLQNWLELKIEGVKRLHEFLFDLVRD